MLETQLLRDDTARRTNDREEIVRAHHNAAIEAGKNEAQRKTIATQLLNDDTMLRGLRADVARLTGIALRLERDHKNASHEMMSLRVAIGGYAAVLGATKD